MRRWWWAAGLCLLLVSGRAGALSLSLATTTPVIGIGQIAFVDVLVANLPEGQALRAFDLDLLFDAPPLAFSSLAFDVFLGTPPAEATTGGGPIASNRVDFAETSILSSGALLELQPGVFRLARIGLLGVELGVAAVAWGPMELIGVGGVPLPVLESSGLEIQVIPEPNATALLAVGLVGLAIGRAGRQRGRSAHGLPLLPSGARRPCDD